MARRNLATLSTLSPRWVIDIHIRGLAKWLPDSHCQRLALSECWPCYAPCLRKARYIMPADVTLREEIHLFEVSPLFIENYFEHITHAHRGSEKFSLFWEAGSIGDFTFFVWSIGRFSLNCALNFKADVLRKCKVAGNLPRCRVDSLAEFPERRRSISFTDLHLQTSASSHCRFQSPSKSWGSFIEERKSVMPQREDNWCAITRARPRSNVWKVFFPRRTISLARIHCWSATRKVYFTMFGARKSCVPVTRAFFFSV